MQHPSEVIEARIRLRIDQQISPQLHRIFSETDSTKFGTLVALMLERCAAYDTALIAQGGQIHAPTPSNFVERPVSPVTEIPSQRANKASDTDASPEIKEEKDKPAPAAIVTPVNQLEPDGPRVETGTPVHDPADMAMALGGLGL